MADSNITKKHHPTGSLARRILFIAILLLVVPLFLQTLFLYIKEYQERLDEIREQYQVLAKERGRYIEEMIRVDWTLLDASQSLDVKQLYIEKIPLPQDVADHFVLVSKRRNALIVGKTVGNHEALIILFPFNKMIDDLGTPDSVRLAIVDESGKVLLENMEPRTRKDLLEIDERIMGTDLTLQLTIPEQLVHGPHLQNYLFRFASLLFFVGVIGGGAVYLFTRRIARPLKNLCRTMERVAEGASHARYTPDRMGFEINQLGLQFNETLDSMLRHAQEAERERLNREKLAEELRIGHEIQSSLLPQHVPGLPTVDIAASYYAAKEVNGDFYDLFRLENGNLLIAMCDTAGKGISACLFSLGLRSMIRSFASTTQDLSEIVRKANDLYCIDAHDSSMFSTLWIGLFNPMNRELVYCSQGHPAAILRRGSEIKELWTDGIALGAQKFDMIPTKTIELNREDLLFLFTDGIIEAHDVDRQLFGKHRLHEFILRKKHESSQQIADQLIEEVQLFSQGAPQHDDITLVVMRIN